MSHLDTRKIRLGWDQRERLCTLGDVLLTVTAAYAHTIDNISLFCFVAKSTSLVRARWARSPVDDVQLAVLPTAVPHPQLRDVQRRQVERRTYRTRSRKRRTSDCFFLYNSPMYLYAPILYVDVSVSVPRHPRPLESIHPVDIHRTLSQCQEQPPDLLKAIVDKKSGLTCYQH
jgi:hypothetical protein